LNAALFVYSRVETWESIEVSGPVRDLHELEKEIARILKFRDFSGPTAFLIKGQAAKMTGHVITKESAGSSSHHLSRYPVTVSDNPIELLGFYATGHRGVFTHGNSDSHVHF
jgi:acetolactate decarboxylase